MATFNEPRKKRARTGFRYSMELNFASEDAKHSFLLRLENTKHRLAHRGSPPLDSRELLRSLLDMVEATPPTNQPAATGSQLQSQAVPTAPATMLDNSGVYWCCTMTCLSDVNNKRTFVPRIFCSRWWRQCWSPVIVCLWMQGIWQSLHWAHTTVPVPS